MSSAFLRIIGIFLSVFDFAPVVKAVQVVDEENNEADYNRNICGLLEGSQNPEYYQYHVVHRIRKGKICAPAEGEVSGGKARCDGGGAEQQVCRFEIS